MNVYRSSNAHQQVEAGFHWSKDKCFGSECCDQFSKIFPQTVKRAFMRHWKQFEDAIRGWAYCEQMTWSKQDCLTLMKRNALEEAQRTASIRFVRLDYWLPSWQYSKLEDSDLRNYYNANQNKYKSWNVRKIEYVVFEPSAEDRQKVNGGDEKERRICSKCKPCIFRCCQQWLSFWFNLPCKRNKTESGYTLQFSIGNIDWSVWWNGSSETSKSVAENFVSDSVKARHILIKIENNDTTKAMALADSLKGALKKGAKFLDLATDFQLTRVLPKVVTSDGSSRATMVKPFNDVHVLMVRKVICQLLFLSSSSPDWSDGKRCSITSDSNRNCRSQSWAFTEDLWWDLQTKQINSTNNCYINNTAELFDSAVVKEGLNKRIADNIRETDKNVPVWNHHVNWFVGPTQLRKVTFPKHSLFGDKYVVAHPHRYQGKGILPMEEVIDQVTSEARKAKKAEMLIEKSILLVQPNVDALRTNWM